MKHIKMCKPRSQEEKNIKHQNDGAMKNQNASTTKRGKVLPSVSEGLGCVPSGNLIDQD